jgi:hypothetical protein
MQALPALDERPALHARALRRLRTLARQLDRWPDAYVLNTITLGEPVPDETEMTPSAMVYCVRTTPSAGPKVPALVAIKCPVDPEAILQHKKASDRVNGSTSAC